MQPNNIYILMLPNIKRFVSEMQKISNQLLIDLMQVKHKNYIFDQSAINRLLSAYKKQTANLIFHKTQMQSWQNLALNHRQRATIEQLLLSIDYLEKTNDRVISLASHYQEKL